MSVLCYNFKKVIKNVYIVISQKFIIIKSYIFK